MMESENMRLVHYGTSTYNPKEFRSISDVLYRTKPDGGLWSSPTDSDYGWREWCINENYATSSLEEGFILDFVGNIFRIDNYSDMGELPWIESSSFDFISFQALLACGYDAVHLTKRGQEATRYTHPKSLYGWDCETVLVMNPSSIVMVPDAERVIENE